MNEEKIINGYYQSNIKTSRNEDSVYAMKYASQQMLIDKLQQENAQLKNKLIEIKKIIDGYMPNEHAMCKAFDEIEFIIKEN